jgi:hypothetical protein
MDFDRRHLGEAKQPRGLGARVAGNDPILTID